MRGQLQEGEFVEPSNNGVEIRDLGIGGREEKREQRMNRPDQCRPTNSCQVHKPNGS